MCSSDLGLCLQLRRFVGIFYKLSFFVPQRVLKILYFSLVHSRILYGIEVYANAFKTYIHDLITLNNRILRIVLKKDRFTHTEELYKLCNTMPIDKLFKLKLLLYAHSQYYKSSNLPNFFHLNYSINSQIHSHDTRTKDDFHIKSASSNIGNRATDAICYKLWNLLPTDTKKTQSTALFKKSIIQFIWQSE